SEYQPPSSVHESPPLLILPHPLPGASHSSPAPLQEENDAWGGGDAPEHLQEDCQEGGKMENPSLSLVGLNVCFLK
ncbi:hypothetical protein O3P69_011757, partial [Scylla paramamosain]